MVVRNGLLDELPNQAHFFSAGSPDKRLNPAGPDHAQVAASGAVLDYVRRLPPRARRSTDRLAAHRMCQRLGACGVPMRMHSPHSCLTKCCPALTRFRMIGPASLDAATGHRCPTIAFTPLTHEPSVVARKLVERGVQTSSGHYYAVRVLNGVGIDPERGVVRLSFVHYTSQRRHRSGPHRTRPGARLTWCSCG